MRRNHRAWKKDMGGTYELHTERLQPAGEALVLWLFASLCDMIQSNVAELRLTLDVCEQMTSNDISNEN